MAAFVGTFFSYDFITRGIPVLDDYCTKRVSTNTSCIEVKILADDSLQYGASWAEYKKKTTFRFIPGLY